MKIFVTKRNAIVLSCLSILLPLLAQMRVIQNKMIIESQVYDHVTGEEIKGPYISIYALPDTVLLQQGIAADYLNGETVMTSKLTIGIDDLDKIYLVKVEKEGYRPGWLKINPATLGRQIVVTIDPIYLKKATKNE